jgi:hypothetical protein
LKIFFAKKAVIQGKDDFAGGGIDIEATWDTMGKNRVLAGG